MITKKMTKNAENFYCKQCNFNCSKQSNYNKHLTTAKHKKITNGNDLMPEKCQTYICKHCDKEFKYASGLSRHSKKCTLKQEPIEETNDKLPEVPSMSMFMELLKQNQELQKQLIEATKAGGQRIENQTNINNNNQKFNLNFFLNEQCKDAINMSDFIENMELDMEDLTETGRLGYVGGISRILINKLQELDVYKRPMHCTDMKREILYIKDNDEWEKQTNSKDKMGNIINRVANKNCRKLPEWTKDHPEYQVFDSPDNMEYIRLTQTVLGGLGEQECKQFKDKIIKGVIKEVVVNK